MKKLVMMIVLSLIVGCATTSGPSPKMGPWDRIALGGERLKMTFFPKLKTECMPVLKDGRAYCEVHMKSIEDADACPTLFEGNFNTQGKWTSCVYVTRDGRPYCAEHDRWDCPGLVRHKRYDDKCIVVEREDRPYCSVHDSYKCSVLRLRDRETRPKKASLFCEEHNSQCGVLLPHKGSIAGKKLQIVGTALGGGLLDRREHTAYAYVK